jgi:CubicO group peptidase (beta-lactamase class C family)
MRRRRYARAMLRGAPLLAIALVVACDGTRAPCDARAEERDPRLAELARFIEGERDRYDVPGVVVAVVEQGGAEHVLTIGRDRPEHDGCQPLRANSPFPGVTLGFIAGALAGLIHERGGVLDLHAPLDEVGAPVRFVPNKFLDEVRPTVHHGLTLRSGMPGGWMGYDVACASDDAPAGWFADHEVELWHRPGRFRMIGELGVNAALLAVLAAERQSDPTSTFDEMIARRVGAPLGLEAGQAPQPAVRGRLSPYGELACGANQLRASTPLSGNDAAKLLRELLGADTLGLGDDITRLYDAGEEGFAPGSAQGYGYFETFPFTGATRLVHSPVFDGGIAIDWSVLPDEGFGVVTIASHGGYPAARISLEAIRIFTGLAYEVRRARPLNHAELVGTYLDEVTLRDGAPRRIVIEERDGRLFLNEGLFEGEVEPAFRYPLLRDTPFQEGALDDVILARNFLGIGAALRAHREDGRVIALVAAQGDNGPPLVKQD